MISPIPLHKGDKVAMVATARKITIPEIENAIALLKKWELVPVLGKTIGTKNFQLSGTAQERATDFQDHLDDPDIKAIWCARGGYGTVQIIDLIDFSRFEKSPKWIIGYSDITVLHSHIHSFGIETLHASMPIDIHKKSEPSRSSLEALIFGKPFSYEAITNSKNRSGICDGEVIGGNLSILYSLLGSKSAIDTAGKILIIEDLDEYLYHIDRMLQNLKRNGYFDKLAGLIIGSMSDIHDHDDPFGTDVQQVIYDITKSYDFPVAFNFPIGHDTDNQAIIFGKKAKLEVNENTTTLQYL